jgi:hypothetical protein
VAVLIAAKEELRDWYDDLSEKDKLLLWQRFSGYLNNSELKLCMSEVRKGREDLFEIHYKHGFIQKYQIYFHQIMRKNYDRGEEYGRED